MIDNIILSLCDYLIITTFNENNEIKFKIIRKENRFDFNRFLTYSIDDKYHFDINSKGQTSKLIYKNNQNTRVRFRVVLNNGINAFLGLSNKNKTSIPTIKLQIENIEEFIKLSF